MNDLVCFKGVYASPFDRGRPLLWLLLIIAAIFFPWLSIIIVGVFVRGYLEKPFGRQIFALVLVGFLGLFNATKKIEGDWYWYISDYLKFSSVNFIDYLESGGLSIRISEPLYYFISFAVSRISDGNAFLFVISITSIIYLTYIFALEKLLKAYGINRLLAAVCIAFAVLAGITFTLTLQLVRQYIAGSMLFLYFIFLLEGKNKKAALIFMAGSLVHNSFAIPGVLLAICVYISSLTFLMRHYLVMVLFFAISGYATGTFITHIVGETVFATAAFKDDGSISKPVLALDVILFLSSLAGVIYFKGKKYFYTKCSAVTALFLALYGGILFGANELTLFLLRSYFYVEWFRVIGIITIVWFLKYRLKMPNSALLIIPLSFLILELRVMQSPFDFGGGAFDHLTGSVSWWANRFVSVSQ